MIVQYFLFCWGWWDIYWLPSELSWPDSFSWSETRTAYPSSATGFTSGFLGWVRVPHLFFVFCFVFCFSLFCSFSPMFPVILNCQFPIVTSVLSNVYYQAVWKVVFFACKNDNMGGLVFCRHINIPIMEVIRMLCNILFYIEV
jgi:hypothetical protein